MKFILPVLFVFAYFSCSKTGNTKTEYSEVQITAHSSDIARVGTSGFTTAGSNDAATATGFTGVSSTFTVMKLSGNYNLFEVFMMGTIEGSVSVQIGYRKANNQTSFFHDVVWSSAVPYTVINGTAPIRYGEMQTFMIYRMEDPTKWRTRIDDTDILEFDVGVVTTGRSPLCGIGVTTSNVKTPTFNFSPALRTYNSGWQDVRNARVVHSQQGIGITATFNNVNIGSKITTVTNNLWQ